MLGVSIGLNALSSHGACTAIFVAVAAIIGFIFASVRTLGRLSWLAWVGTACVLVSVFVLTVAAGVQERPAEAPQDGPWSSDFKIIGNPTFEEAMAAVSSLVLAYAGVPAFFAVASEMSDPRLYTRSVLTCQAVATVTYSVIGIVVYYYCGSYVASPALGSAGVLMKKVCYGLVLPGLIVSTLLYIHVRLALSGTAELTELTMTSSLRSTLWYASSEALSISLQTLGNTGLRGCAVPASSHSSPTLLLPASQYSRAWYPWSVRCSALS
jgi:hypothetical protein